MRLQDRGPRCCEPNICKTPDDYDLGSIPGFRLIFARVFYHLSWDDSPWKRFQISTPISLRFRVKLICIFSADHENVVYRKLIYQKSSQPPQQSGGRLRRYRWSCSVLDVFVRLSSSWASAYDFLLFSRWECAAFFGQTGGREYSNSINVVKGSVDNSPKGAQLLVNSLCSFEVTLLHFGVTLLQDSTYIVQVPLPVFCARFPLNVGLPPRKERPPSRARVWLQKVGRGTIPWSPALRGKVRKQFILNFAQGVGKFSEGGQSLDIARGTKLIIRAVNANSKGLMTMHTWH